jgi:hypothetical protein
MILKLNLMKAIMPVVLLLPVILSSCKSDSKPLLPNIGGKPGDVAVVISKADWDGKIGEEYRKVFSVPYEMLPQYEPVYDLININYDAFNELFQRHRNIIFTEISGRYTKARMLVEHDRYAQPQLLIHLQAPDDISFIRLLNASEQMIFSYLERAERDRLLNLYKKTINKDIQDRLRQKHNVSLIIPKGYSIVRDAEDFTWVNQDVGPVILGLVLYQYPYKDTVVFSLNKLIRIRDSFMQKYMPGEVEGSFMTTEKEFAPVYSEYLYQGKKHVAEMRGLWKTEKGVSMGGPFISISMMDEKNSRILTVEGFVYAAGHDKRNYMRQLEAILYSMKLPEGEVNSNQ